MMKRSLLLAFACACSFLSFAQAPGNQPKTGTKAKETKTEKAAPAIVPGAARINEYLPLLNGKRVGIFANHTSMVGERHLVDTLYTLGVRIVKAFGPEHGFRGTADAGEKIDNYMDPTTGIPVVSLYGQKKRPSAEDLANVDVLIFDIQDVGTRFYTYISSLQEFMDAAFEYGKPLLLLDRPNPNGFYIDGPVLDTAYKSFVGMQPIPVVYGMTMGEYALMLAGEKWLSPKANERYEYYQRAMVRPDTPFHFQVIKNQYYTHKSQYELPVKPSPNLPDMASVYWYASTCFFEGTVMSEGRGTAHPFAIFGHPYLPKNMYAFTPTSRDGAKEPKLKDRQSYGWNLNGKKEEVLKKMDNKIQIKYLLEAYKLFPNKAEFFIKPKSEKPTDYFFNKLAGSDQLMEQIKAGKTEKEIRDSWKPGIDAFKKIRKKYLLYTDFE
jgi:uncharacterized protein YbbC (DUF1343 family)